MSRVGKQPIGIPSGVEVKVDGQTVTIKGSKGTLVRTISDRISMAVEGDQILVTRVDEDRESRAEHGLFRSLIANMVIGVSEGYGKELEIRGVGYRASMKGSNIELLVGFSHPVLMETPEGITVEVPEPTRINVSGIDKELVGQIAANIRSARPPEPYKGKGIRYVGEHVRRKAGKAGVAQ
jgi:large subunit ribosomal protein L6